MSQRIRKRKGEKCRKSGFRKSEYGIKNVLRTGTFTVINAAFDPCHLVWQVKEIGWLERTPAPSSRPLPVYPAGESDFLAITVAPGFSSTGKNIA
jgi:hypothetical protein